ncbi:MAG: methionyl-tRNA synthetase [Glaciecola sp.]
METKITEQYFDPQAQRFLPDRYVEGTCPSCAYTHARGDQCDQCGKTLDPTDLVDPRSKLTGATPERRNTEHYFMLLSKLQDQVKAWLETTEGWRPHVINWAMGVLGDEGLLDRSITRDLAWGVPIPEEFDTIGEGKRIYVWFDAVIGYLSAAMEWAQRSGDPDAWEQWWKNPDAESYYFIGKDNIPFHALFWPAYLLGYGELNMPTNVPANQYVTFKGAKASKSMGVGVPAVTYLDRYEPDGLRYALAGILPETNDTDLTEEGMVDRINNELVATWGNLVNRVIAMTGKYFDGVVPEVGERDEIDEALLATVDRVLTEEALLIEQVELRAALRTAMEGASAANVYLSERAPWTTAKTDMARTATTLRTALDAINGLKVALAPFVPFSTAKLHGMLRMDGAIEDHGWTRQPMTAGVQLDPPAPLYAKVELLEPEEA